MEPTFVNLDKCPICGAVPLPIGNHATFVRAFDKSVETRFAVCSSCDFSFATSAFDQATMRRYYAHNDQLRRESATVEELSHVAGQVSFLRRYVLGQLSAARLLEIGPDGDLFLKQTGSDGHFLEFNVEARERLSKLGYSDAIADASPFDVIALRHVFEHIAQPARYLAGLRERLTRDGIVFIEVPDCSNLSLDLSDVFQLEHVSYFTTSSMTRLASVAGYRILGLEITRTPGYSTTPNLVLRTAMTPIPSIGRQDHRHWIRLLVRGQRGLAAVREMVTDRTAFYGAGTRTLEYASLNPSRMPHAIYDRDPKKIGKTVGDVAILDAEALRPDSFDRIVLMVTGYEREVRDFLTERGISSDRIVALSALESQ